MTEKTAETTTTDSTGTTAATGTTAPGKDVATPPRSEGGPGRTSIADTVVSKIAGIATREISGVHGLGGGATRAVGALRDRIPGSRTNMSQGVGVEVGERQAAVDLDIVAEYGVSIADLAGSIRRNVISSVERMTGLEVTEVNITVHDIVIDDGADETESTSVSRVE